MSQGQSSDTAVRKLKEAEELLHQDNEKLQTLKEYELTINLDL